MDPAQKALVTVVVAQQKLQEKLELTGLDYIRAQPITMDAFSPDEDFVIDITATVNTARTEAS